MTHEAEKHGQEVEALLSILLTELLVVPWDARGLSNLSHLVVGAFKEGVDALRLATAHHCATRHPVVVELQLPKHLLATLFSVNSIEFPLNSLAFALTFDQIQAKPAHCHAFKL